jgi:hypothetical protein
MGFFHVFYRSCYIELVSFVRSTGRMAAGDCLNVLYMWPLWNEALSTWHQDNGSGAGGVIARVPAEVRHWVCALAPRAFRHRSQTPNFKVSVPAASPRVHLQELTLPCSPYVSEFCGERQLIDIASSPVPPVSHYLSSLSLQSPHSHSAFPTSVGWQLYGSSKAATRWLVLSLLRPLLVYTAVQRMQAASWRDQVGWPGRKARSTLKRRITCAGCENPPPEDLRGCSCQISPPHTHPRHCS